MHTVATIVSLLIVAAAFPASSPAASRWQPAPTIAPWQWQLSGRVGASARASVYDIDGFEASGRLVRALHRKGRRVICYVSVGTYESVRPDAGRFPVAVRGRRLVDHPKERWLDIRRIDLLAPIIRDRFKACARKGFDAIEPDNVDGYANRSGFPLTGTDQLAFNRFVAQAAHDLGVAVGLKNDADQVTALVGDFDFAVVEQCFQFRECGRYAPFVRSGKAVFAAEYRSKSRRLCRQAKRRRISLIFKRTALGRYRRSC